jgi:hypothetical protein
MRDEGGPIPSQEQRILRSNPGLNERKNIMHPRLFRLLEIHQRIDDDLRRELRRRWPDPLRVLQLKKLKLRVKDRLYGLTPKPRTV